MLVSELRRHITLIESNMISHNHLDERQEIPDTINSIQHMSKNIGGILSKLGDLDIIYRAHGITDWGYETPIFDEYIVKISNDVLSNKIDNGFLGNFQGEIFKSLDIHNPTFCTMERPDGTGYTKSSYGFPWFFIPPPNTRFFWSPEIYDIGSGDGEFWNKINDLPVDQQLTAIKKLYKTGSPPNNFKNEIIADCKYYYLLNVAKFLKKVDKTLVGQYHDNHGHIYPQIEFYWEKLTNNLNSYNDLSIIFNKIIPDHIIKTI